MTLRSAAALSLLLILPSVAGCGKSSKKPAMISREPVSVRGWVADFEPVPSSQSANAPMRHDPIRRAQMFADAAVSVEGVPYASGGIMENGAFVILDVPPGNAIINFQAPGIPLTQIHLANLPPNADVVLPALEVYTDKVVFQAPGRFLMRLPAEGDISRGVASKTTVNGVSIRAVEVPISQLVDRRDYPQPLSVATYR